MSTPPMPGWLPWTVAATAAGAICLLLAVDRYEYHRKQRHDRNQP